MLRAPRAMSRDGAPLPRFRLRSKATADAPVARLARSAPGRPSLQCPFSGFWIAVPACWNAKPQIAQKILVYKNLRSLPELESGNTLCYPSARTHLLSNTAKVSYAPRSRGIIKAAVQLAVVVVLLCLAIANISVRATWT